MHEIKNYNDKIPFFDPIVQDNFPFIAQDFDSLTLYEKYAKIVGYLNAVIKKTDLTSEQMEKLVKLQEELTDFVNNYFNNLDVQDEINKKLDEMVTDGTFDSIINDRLFNDLKSQIESISTITTQNTSDIAKLKQDIINKFAYYEVDTIEDLIKHFESAEHCYIHVKKEKNTGIYSFTKTQYINSNKIIICDDDVQITNTLNFIFYDPNNPNVVRYEGFKNIYIEGGNWQNTCFSIAHAQNIVFNNIKYKNANQHHIFQIASSKNIKVLNSSFIGMCEYKEADGIKDNPTKDMINIDPMKEVSFPVFDETEPFYDNYINENITIDNCVFGPNTAESLYNHAYSGIGAHSANAGSEKYHKNINITNCVFNNFSVHALRVQYMKNVKILYNECNNSYRFITSYTGRNVDIQHNICNNIKNFLYISANQENEQYIDSLYYNISYNYIRFTKDLDGSLYPLNQNGTIMDFFHVSEVVISNNIIMNSEIMFLRLTDSKKVTISNNQFTSINVRLNNNRLQAR